jgi:hypothetical protein
MRLNFFSAHSAYCILQQTLQFLRFLVRAESALKICLAVDSAVKHFWATTEYALKIITSMLSVRQNYLSLAEYALKNMSRMLSVRQKNL